MSDAVSWTEPTIKCPHKFKINHHEVEPNLKSPHRFSIGLNNIKNIFKLYGGKMVTCTIKVYVRSCIVKGKFLFIYNKWSITK